MQKVTVTVIQESAEDLDINSEGIGWFGMMNLMRAHLLAMIGHTGSRSRWVNNELKLRQWFC